MTIKTHQDGFVVKWLIWQGEDVISKDRHHGFYHCEPQRQDHSRHTRYEPKITFHQSLYPDEKPAQRKCFQLKLKAEINRNSCKINNSYIQRHALIKIFRFCDEN